MASDKSRQEEYIDAVREAVSEQEEPAGAYGDVTPSGEDERIETAIADGVGMYDEAAEVEGEVIWEICRDNNIRYKTDYVYREITERLRDEDSE